MEPGDDFRNVPRKEQSSSSSDDDEFAPLRKRIKIDNDSDDGTTQGNYETNSDQNTQETVLTSASWDAAEASENLASNGDQQSVVSVVPDGNNNDSLAIDQSTHESQIDINNSVSDDTKTDPAVSLESTVQPDTRYVIPKNSFYRPSISELTTKHNISSPTNETDNKPDKPNTANDISANLEQIRRDFIRSWDRILTADDLIPDVELATLNSTVPENICQYLDDLGATNSTNEALAELIPRVCDEIFNLQQRDERVNEFQSFEPEPEPIPFTDFLTEPLELLESSEHGVGVEEFDFDFDINHWNRIQQAFTIPEQIPDFDELFTNRAITVPSSTENDTRIENPVYQTLTNVPNELAHIYSTIVREAVRNQHSNVSAANRVQSENLCSSNYINSDSNSIRPNYDADLYRSLLGIPSPFARTANTSNEQTAMTELDNILNRSVEPERVRPEIYSSRSAVKPNSAEYNMYITKLESTPQTNPTELETNPNGLETNPSRMETNPVELNSTPYDFEINPAELGANARDRVTNTIEMETNHSEMERIPAGMETNTVELHSSVVDSETNLTELQTNFSEMETNRVELHSTPVDFATNSVEMETSSVQMQTKSVELEINAIACDTNPADLNTSPVESASNSDVFGSNSNEEDSEASNSSGSEPYEGYAYVEVTPGKNDCKPLKIFMMNPNDAAAAQNANNAPTLEQSTSNEIADAVQAVTNGEEEIDGVETENDFAIQEMNRFETELSTIETEINIIIDEANRFEQQAARFEETASEFQDVEGFFRQISEIYEFAAVSLQEAIDDFESTPIEEATNIVNELDPLSEGIAVEDDNIPDQEVPDIEDYASSNSESS